MHNASNPVSGGKPYIYLYAVVVMCGILGLLLAEEDQHVSISLYAVYVSFLVFI